MVCPTCENLVTKLVIKREMEFFVESDGERDAKDLGIAIVAAETVQVGKASLLSLTLDFGELSRRDV